MKTKLRLLTLLFSLLTVATGKAEKYYGIIIGDIRVTSENCQSANSWSYDPDANVLHLNDGSMGVYSQLQIEKKVALYIESYICNGLKIQVDGNFSFYGMFTTGIQFVGDGTHEICGKGKLTINTTEVRNPPIGICSTEGVTDLTIKDLTLNIEVPAGSSYGFYNRNFSRIALDNCEININSNNYAWYGQSDWNSVNPKYNNCYCYNGKFVNGSAVAFSGDSTLESLTIRRCVYVNSVELSVASPVVGEPLPTTASVINSSNNPYNIQVKNMIWYRVYSGSISPLDEGYVCKLGEVYSVACVLYLNGQDVFLGSSVTATVNGKAASTQVYTGADMNVFYTFPQLANTYYDVWVGGMQVNDINKSDVLDDGGSVSFIKNVFGKYVLILENANITNTGNTQYDYTGNGWGIYSNIPDLTIRVKGNNTIDSKGEGIYFTGNLSISGSSDNQGKLSVKGSFGICPARSSTATTMTIGGVQLTAEGTNGAGIGGATSFSSNYNCTMKVGVANTVVKAKGTSVSLGNLYDLVFEDGLDIVQPTGASFNGEDVIDANGNIIKGSWVIIKGESGISTGVALPQDKAQSQDAWYTLDGRKLNGQPTKKGVYIHNGKTVIR